MESLSQFSKFSKILSANCELKTSFYDVTKENLHYFESMLFQKKMWQSFVRKSLLRMMKQLAICDF